MRSHERCALLAVALLGVPCLALAAESVLNSKHNLSVSGPGTAKAVGEAEVCVFCHAPHNAGAEAPLWNRYVQGTVYLPYSSSTAAATPGQPTGASKLCLSCHDGTIALGMVRSREVEIPFAGGGTMPPGGSLIGADLTDDHPVSFVFDQALASQSGELVDPSLLTAAVRLDAGGNLQCTSCHDPHDDAYGRFLVMPNSQASLCTTCHVASGWGSAVHRFAGNSWNGQPPDPWPHTERTTVSDNACESCHRPHGAALPQRLQTFPLSEGSCLACHNGHVAPQDISSELAKTSAHPVTVAELHDPGENLLDPPRHVECVDCHDPHAAGGWLAGLPRALFGVRGLSSAGLPLSEISNEYELCFRCHADSIDRGSPLLTRQFPQTNTRLEFDPAGLSYHPVVAAGRNPNVPSLVGGPYTTSGRIECTACHSSEDGPGTGGTGPYGPHGSIYPPILERRLVLTDGTTPTTAVYALCFKCHSWDSIMQDDSFSEHTTHVDYSAAPMACSSCHDPHGVPGVPHLINFNMAEVTTSSGGLLQFIDNGTFAGSCYLTCHGVDHNPNTYPPP